MRVGTRVFLAAVLLPFTWAGAETREESIAREQRYLAEHPVEEVAHYWDEVQYARAGDEALTLDISAPEGDGPFPCVMVIHGGGWTLHRNSIMEGMSRYITNRGYVVFNINYRVLPEVTMKEIVEDCLGALIWVKEHAAAYKGDPSRLCVTGDSAGGHLTAMLLTQGRNPEYSPTYAGKPETDRSIACAIPTYGVFDFVEAPLGMSVYLKRLLGEDPAVFERFSPYRHLRKDLPPQLVIVGTRDFLQGESKKYAAALESLGAPVELELYPNLPHAFLNHYWLPEGKNGYDRMIAFMDARLKAETGAEPAR